MSGKKRFRRLGLLLILVGSLPLAILSAAAMVYPPEYVYRVIAWRESDALDWQKFPSHPLHAAAHPHQFEQALDSRVPRKLAQLAGAPDWDGFLEETKTQSFIVIEDGKIRYEGYFNGMQRNSMVTSFSVAKSFTSTLIGIAIEEGFIKSVDESIANYLPELSRRDPRFKSITIRHLLRMASGMDYQAFRCFLFNGDDPLTTYYPDQRRIALENTRIIDPPGEYFLYNKYAPQLLGMILERSTGMTVTEFMQSRLWEPLGMEYDGSWSTDSKSSDFEKMETGVNARAIDFAKLGVLFLNKGRWEGKQILSEDWVKQSTEPYFPKTETPYYSDWFASLPGKSYYGYMWWGMARDENDYDFAAEGDKGQFIYVSPGKKLVIVRNGIDFGIPAQQWLHLFYEFAQSYRSDARDSK
ncbi:MAG: serine hydrolase [Leptospiraceae bacterium]|nr:serine hydrolase [Leptospiraceae bacterium]